MANKTVQQQHKSDKFIHIFHMKDESALSTRAYWQLALVAFEKYNNVTEMEQMSGKKPSYLSFKILKYVQTEWQNRFGLVSS